MSTIYLVLGCIGILYTLSLLILNFIPHVHIKRIGWFSLYKITISLSKVNISIERIGIRINIFRKTGSPFKYFHLEVKGVVILLKKRKPKSNLEQDDQTSESLNKNQDNGTGAHKSSPLVPNEVKFAMNKRIFNFLYSRRALNQIMVHLVALKIQVEGSQQKYVLDYIRVENFFNIQHTNKFVIHLFNGFLSDSLEKEEKYVKFYRTIELGIRCDTEAKHEGNKMSVRLFNFDVSISFVRLSVPFDFLKKHKTTDSSVEFPDPAQTDLAAHESHCHIIQEKSVEAISDILENVLKTFEIKFEDFSISIGSYELKISNFSTLVERTAQGNVKFSFYVVSTRLYHKGSNCFELPSLSQNLDFSVDHLSTAIAALIHNRNPTSAVNLVERLMITNPVFNIYYDQLQILADILLDSKRSTESKKVRKKLTPEEKEKYYHCLTFLGEISAKISLVDMKVNVHIPYEISKFDRNDPNNSIITFHLSLFSTKFLASKKHGILTDIIKLKNVRITALDNVISISQIVSVFKYSIKELNIAARLIINKIKITSINDAIFHLVRRIRNEQIRHYNKKYAERCDIPHKSKDTDGDEQFLDLFKILPEYVSRLKLEVSSVQADIVCKDGLPSEKIYDPEFDKEVDLKDFKVGISLRLSNIIYKYNREKKVFKGGVQLIELFTLTDYTESGPNIGPFKESQVESQDKSDSEDFSDLESIESDLEDDAVLEQRAKKNLILRDITMTNHNNDEDYNKLFFRFPESDLRITTFLIFCIFYAIRLLKYFGPTEKKVCSAQEMAAVVGPKKRLKFDLLVDSLACVFRLPNDVEVMLELDTLSAFALRAFRLSFARLYIKHPATQLWARLLVLNSPSIDIENEKELEVKVDCQGVRMIISHQFALYTVFDNFITLYKAVKQIKQNIYQLPDVSELKRIYPKARNALKFPYVQVKSKNFLLLLDDDPFEHELSLIFEFGKIAQSERLRLQKIFDEKSQSIRDSSIEERIKLRDGPSSPLSNSNNSYTYESLNHPLEDGDAEEVIAKGQQNLYETFSMSWIKSYRLFKKKKIEIRKKKVELFWAEEAISKTIRSKYEIMNYSIGTQLFSGLIRDFNLELSPARIDNLHQFIFDNAKGQTKRDYSILVPLYFNLRCLSAHFLLKDYPLPILSLPHSDNEDGRPVFHMRGNIVINESLVKRKEQMRYIFVPFMPIAKPSGESEDGTPLDFFYSTFVARTLCPVKFILDLECDLVSDRPCSIAWCKSYVPALSATMRAFDNFTKPKVDDSPLGWWDKMALNMHGHVEIRVANEITLHMKSSLDPYKLIGEAAGLVFAWKNLVKININPSGKWNELMTVESDDFILAVPNYSIKESGSWSLYTEAVLRSHREHVSESNKYSKKLMTLSSDQKVVWTLGLLFERNKNSVNMNKEVPNLSADEERTHEFKPHYDVVVTNPHFPNHPDSYEGFRSDYIHLAISVDSSRGNSHNSIYLSPMTFYYFFDWWHVLTKTHSPPIKQGKLFASNLMPKSHVKMGLHLFTVKYQLKLCPLTLSHLYKHSTSEDLDKRNRIAYTGLKGKFDKCIVDLHQKKLPVRYINRKLNKNNKVLHLKMNAGAVDISGADIRLLKAVFNERSITGYLASHLGDTISETDPIYLDESSAESISYGDWTDIEDFIELEERELLSHNPRIVVLPFFSSPFFSYVREFVDQEFGTYPFGNEPSHACELGNSNPEKIQQDLTRERLNEIENLIKSTNAIYSKIKDEAKLERLSKKLKSLNERKEILSALVSRLNDEMDCKSVCSDSTYMTNRLSVYASHRSEDEIDLESLMNQGAIHYHNRFIIHNMKLLWDTKLRDYILDYGKRVGDRRHMVYFTGKRAVDFIEGLIDQMNEPETKPKPKATKVESDSVRSGEDIIHSFEQEITKVKEGQEAERNYLIKFIHPQVELSTTRTPKKALIVSRDIELRVIDINKAGLKGVINDNEIHAGLIETRFGVLLQDSSVLVFDRSQTSWLNIESCYDNSWNENELVVEKNSIGVCYNATNKLSEAIEHETHLRVHLCKVVVSATSEQYSSLVDIFKHLLIRNKTKQDRVLERLEKVVSLSEITEFEGLDKKIIELQANIRRYRDIFLSLRQKGIQLTDIEANQLRTVELEAERVKIELFVLMKSLGSKRLKKQTKREFTKNWRIQADQVVFHLLENNRDPLVDIALANPMYTRHDLSNGTRTHNVIVRMFQGFNLKTNAVYPELLRPLEETDKNIIEISWTMMDPVGGIRLMQDASISIEPLKIELDYQTASTLSQYINETKNSSMDVTKQRNSTDNNNNNHHHHIISKLSEESKNPFKRLRKKLTPHSDAVSSSSNEDTQYPVSPSTSTANSAETQSIDSDFSVSVDESNSDDDITRAINRSAKYFSIVELKLKPFKIMVSLKAPKHLNLIDFHKLVLTIPELEYRDKIWSSTDAVSRLKKDIIKIILGHSGQIITNKFKMKKRQAVSTPLKQIEVYDQLMTVEELQQEGRPRDSAKTDAEHVHPHIGRHSHRHRKNHHGNRSHSEIRSSEDFSKYLEKIEES